MTPGGPRDRPDTEPDDSPGADLPEPRALPPGGRTFTIEDRPAPGLYFAAWLLTVGSLALLLVGFVAGDRLASAGLLFAALVAFTLGLSAAAGYQVLARADRHPAAYRGPSPPIVFGVLVGATLALVLVLSISGLLRPGGPLALLLGLLVVGIGYVVSVVLFVVRTRALSWREIVGRRPGEPFGEGVFVDVAFGLVGALGAYVISIVVAFIVAGLLGVRPPEQLPEARTAAEWLIIALAAAVVAPVGEELFFRGFALRAWERDIGPRRALMRSALFFAIVHIADVQAQDASTGLRQAFLVFAVILPVGVVLGTLYQYRGLLASITGHATFNGIQLALLFALSQSGPLP